VEGEGNDAPRTNEQDNWEKMSTKTGCGGGVLQKPWGSVDQGRERRFGYYFYFQRREGGVGLKDLSIMNKKSHEQSWGTRHRANESRPKE